jgi:hypothetical protein
MSLKTINDGIKKLIPNVELVRGDGYHYFVYDDGGARYETESVMVPYTNLYSRAEWIQMALKFWKERG